MVNDVILRYVRDDEKEFVIDGSRWAILGDDGIEGIDFADWSLYSEQLAFRNGSVVTGASYSSRAIYVTIVALDTDADLREEVRSFFNPDNRYDLHVTYRGRTRWISGVIESFEIDTKMPYVINQARIGLFCEDPFFNKEEAFNRDLGELAPRFGFPYIATASYSPVYTSRVFSERTWLVNDGDVETPFMLDITFTTSTSGFKIEQGNKVFEINNTFINNDYLFIDFDTYIVTLNGNPIWNKVKSNSSKLSIPRGGTWLRVTSTTGQPFLHPRVFYYERFGGL